MIPGLGENRVRVHVAVHGQVQGVGFRPYVAALARGLDLAGWVLNARDGVHLEIEGEAACVDQFLDRLPGDAPEAASIGALGTEWCSPLGDREFVIRESLEAAPPGSIPQLLPDLATCPECLAEIRDPANRRYRYPFTNCTQCGPRFSILEGWPYDRHRTSMRHFTQCARCAAEYADPSHRRYHAQPNACPECGPQVSFVSREGRVLARREKALILAIQALRDGAIVAVKGIGGFHLWGVAHDESVVGRLRDRKSRRRKPLAIMVPSVAYAQSLCQLDECEEQALRSSAAPIVLAKRRIGRSAGDAVEEPAPSVAPGMAWLGILLPYSPLHHLLLADLACAVVATSGNRSGEPLCHLNDDALERLAPVADCFLMHDRQIVRPLDDSVVRLVDHRVMTLRHARGFAPSTLPACPFMRAAAGDPRNADAAILGVGGQGKVALALGTNDAVVVGPHLGDMDNLRAVAGHEGSIRDLTDLLQVRVDRLAADLHPNYASTRWACTRGLPVRYVQHHLAHLFAVVVEHGLSEPVLGVAWDGTGDGGDGTVWGGEFILWSGRHVQRVGRLRPFPLPGGEAAAREPRRVAVALLRETFEAGEWQRLATELRLGLSDRESDLLDRMIARGVNSPTSTSVGRLFDGVAALLGLSRISDYEGEAAMILESVAERVAVDLEAYPVGLVWNEPERLWELDWREMVRCLVTEAQRGRPVPELAARFHHGLGAAIAAVASRMAQADVVLTGGCFQNARLASETLRELRHLGLRGHLPARIPPNDGGLALGQVAAACWFEREGTPCV